MKKVLWILVLSLLTCNISFADNLKIVYGDTIVLNGEKIRFTGIDTPELKQTCLQGEQELDCGMTAKMLLVKRSVTTHLNASAKEKMFTKELWLSALLMVKVYQVFWLEAIMPLPIENIQRNLLKMKSLPKLTNSGCGR